MNLVSDRIVDRRYFTSIGAGVYMGPALYPHRVTSSEQQLQLRQINRETEELRDRLKAEGREIEFDKLKLNLDNYSCSPLGCGHQH